MTDNEIIKDLECCSKRGNCNICSRYTIPYPTCKEQLCESACHLIQLQKAEIKEWQDAFINEERIKVVKKRTIKEFVDFIVEELCIGRGDDRSELYVCEDDIRDLIKRFLDGENIETQKETETGK